MSVLYKKPEDVIYKVDIAIKEDEILLVFYSDCGKHGTFEMLDGYRLSPKRLLEILQKNEDYTEDDL
jgi:hypothetical protein